MPEKSLSRKEQTELYNKLVATHAEAVRKGDTIPYTSVNGHMYSYLSKDGFLALRLPEVSRNEFLEKYKTTLVTAYGIVQKEYVNVPDSLLAKTDELKRWFGLGYEYTAALKPKPSKSKRSQ
jgi:TfoX/Sxy family transcriptional regulator of competence genes